MIDTEAVRAATAVNPAPPAPPQPAGIAQTDAPDRPEVAFNPIDNDGVASPARRQVVLGVAACGAALALGLHLNPAQAAVSYGDGDALRFLEELENFQADLFDKALRSAPVQGLDNKERNVLTLIAAQDREHRDWCRLARGKVGIREGEAPAGGEPLYAIGRHDFDTMAKVFGLTIQVKELAVQAYQHVVQNADDDKMIEAFASLAGVEGRHAATLREVAGLVPITGAFESSMNLGSVTSRLWRYGFRGSAQP